MPAYYVIKISTRKFTFTIQIVKTFKYLESVPGFILFFVYFIIIAIVRWFILKLESLNNKGFSIKNNTNNNNIIL